MPFKTILTVTEPGLGERDLRMAASLSAEVEAHLSVLVVQFVPPPPVGEFAAIGSGLWVEQRQDDVKLLAVRLAEVRAVLDSTGISADVASSYPEVALGDEVIGRRGLHCDVTVVGPEVLATQLLRDKAIEGALFSSGRPLLLIPAGVTPTLSPKRIVVAWDGRVEAGRAVREALEMIASADEVSLLLVDPIQGDAAHGAEPGADAATYLARHGAKVVVQRLPSEGRSTEAIIRRHAADFGADLLVMGAYGHSRLRERVFGGVTRSILDEPSVSTLLAR